MRKHIKKTLKKKINVKKNTKKIYIGGEPRSESLSLGRACDAMGNIVGSENSIENVNYWLNDYLNENPDDTEIKELRDLLIIADQNIKKVYNDLENITNQ